MEHAPERVEQGVKSAHNIVRREVTAMTQSSNLHKTIYILSQGLGYTQ